MEEVSPANPDGDAQADAGSYLDIDFPSELIEDLDYDTLIALINQVHNEMDKPHAGTETGCDCRPG
ncbi:MAG: hypothetical protein R3D29_15340 [Nitratireductor sp.]